MSEIIQFTSDYPRYTFQTTLDNIVYNFEVRWNTLNEFWTFDMLDIGNSPILNGVKIVLGYPLIRRFFKTELPGGDIVAVDTTQSLQRVGRQDLGNNVKMVYFTKDEL